MLRNPSPLPDDTRVKLNQPQSLRTLASNRTNWTLALHKHPESAFPRVHELYQEHLDLLKQAHKHLLTLCMNEAFYHNLPIQDLRHDVRKLIKSVPDSKWTDAKYTETRIQERFSRLSSHGRKVVRATIGTYSIRMYLPVYEMLLKKMMMEVLEWQMWLSEQKDVKGRVVDRVGKLTFEKQTNGNSRVSEIPLIAYLVLDIRGKDTLDDTLRYFSMLPETVLDGIFPPDDD